MKNKQIIDAWNKIEPDEVAKKQMLKNILSRCESTASSKGRNINIKKIFVPIAACLILIVVLKRPFFSEKNVPNSNLVDLEENEQSNNAEKVKPTSKENSTTFDGFVLMAYTPKEEGDNLGTNYKDDTIPTELIPNVEVMISNYDPLMSSVPGLPFTFAFNDIVSNSLEAYSMKIEIDNGELLSWNSKTGIVTSKGTSTFCKNGDTLYWTPLIPLDGDETIEEDTEYEGEFWGNHEGVVEKAQINITALKEGKEIGKQTISIAEIDGKYYATVGELVII